jgi:NAD(P)-dependent dehydrogenase (short-subunit alcohol dehydrogenase family)
MDSHMPVQKSKVVVVTGATLGLGKTIAHAFVRCGDNVVIAARPGDTLEETVAEFKQFEAGRVLSVVCDVASKEGRAKLIDGAMAAYGAIDVFVNNAGTYGPIGPLEENDEDSLAENIQVNLIAPAMLIRAVIPILPKQGGGHIINISGGGAVKPTPTFSAYAAAKAGIVRLTETLA